jgi:hypothetical protein
MDSGLIAALISGVITIIGIGIAYVQWRRDVQIKIEHLRDQVTAELIQQRVEPYSALMRELEPMSTLHREKIQNHPNLVRDFLKVFQEAVYGSVGLLASSDTRQILVYARWGCILFAEGKISYDKWLKRIWAVHLAIRSDLGIIQPNWPSEIERLRKQIIAETSRSIAEQVESIIHLAYDDELRIWQIPQADRISE